jgi:hypothetical protein
VNKRMEAAVIRLNEAKTLGGIEPFNCASGHKNPFIAIRIAARICVTQSENDF